MGQITTFINYLNIYIYIYIYIREIRIFNLDILIAPIMNT